MKNLRDKETLWSILEKYDRIVEYKNFCDSLSRSIQGKSNDNDMLVIYKHFVLIDKEDLSKIESTIGEDINSLLFTI